MAVESGTVQVVMPAMGDSVAEGTVLEWHKGVGDQVQADLIAINWRHADLDVRRSAICEFAEKLTATPHAMSEGDLQGLRDVGLTHEEVWDVVEIASMYNFTNRLALALDQRPNEEYHRLDR